MVMRRLLHLEQQDGKKPAHFHFAIASRIVERFIESLRLKVEPPADLVSTLNHCNGMADLNAVLSDAKCTVERGIVHVLG